MTRWMALLALVPACGFSSGKTSDGSVGDDGAPGTPVCFGSFVKVCFPASAVPTTSRAFNDATTAIDTDSTTQCDQQNDQRARYCVIAGNGFTLAGGQKLTAHGGKPLVLLSTTMFDSSGDIDVSSSRAGAQATGAGANPSDCVTGTPPVGSAGGYGGSLHGKGGSGSAGNPSDGAGGGAADAVTAFPVALRGGCAGGSGLNIGPLGEGVGGSGGGAVAIIAAQIHIDGNINASGAGGRGASTIKTGGGGGGSGGMIVLDSSMIQSGSRAKIWANGGGGAQGGALNMGGNNGNESVLPDQGAAATAGTTEGANGGAGSVGVTLIGQNGKSDARSGGGGGGGGGGAGFIHAAGLTDPASISPPSSGL